ncbi:heat shock protein transcriptional repressor HspR [Pseudactinotalea suaedae]|jgi:MerR family transcriptional regulator/heat shock protein HspR|uniref:heat shock protein transcriptional repressor HspR n=1 Tax=Pseudactinotalea suaedae TaxID=1524924 RepID=UPI0012E2A6A3|nr:helix-turn-helix transcriptional regulator [Pseudactinotalea suaedae]
MTPPRYGQPVFLISEAAARAGMHAQTLRTYDRLGLVVPQRAAGRGRRYSERDVDKLREIQRLSQEEGINLAGIARIFDLVEENEQLRDRLEQLLGLTGQRPRVFTASPSGDIVATKPGARVRRASTAGALVVWRPSRD